MAGIRIHVVMPAGLIERIDSARGEGQSRGDWVRRAVERALEESGAHQGAVVSTSSPAPAEQPEQDPQPSGEPRATTVSLGVDSRKGMVGPAAGDSSASRHGRSAEQPTVAELRDAWELERRTVSPSGPTPPRVPSARQHLPNCKCPVCS